MTTNLMLRMGYSASAATLSKELKQAEHNFSTRSDFLTSIPTPPPLEFSLGGDGKYILSDNSPTKNLSLSHE